MSQYAEIRDDTRMEDSSCSCKVGNLVAEWDIDNVHDEVVADWAGGDVSLREGAKLLNRSALQAALEAVNRAPLDGEVENRYRLLTADGVSEGMRVQARNRLEREGVDVSRLESAFVSYQTLRRHLQDCLAVERENDPPLSPETAKTRVDQLRSRTEAVSESTMEQLQREGTIEIEEPDVFVDIRVTCRSCGEQYTFAELVSEETCGCPSK